MLRRGHGRRRCGAWAVEGAVDGTVGPLRGGIYDDDLNLLYYVNGPTQSTYYVHREQRRGETQAPATLLRHLSLLSIGLRRSNNRQNPLVLRLVAHNRSHLRDMHLTDVQSIDSQQDISGQYLTDESG